MAAKTTCSKIPKESLGNRSTQRVNSRCPRLCSCDTFLAAPLAPFLRLFEDSFSGEFERYTAVYPCLKKKMVEKSVRCVRRKIFFLHGLSCIRYHLGSLRVWGLKLAPMEMLRI